MPQTRAKKTTPGCGTTLAMMPSWPTAASTESRKMSIIDQVPTWCRMWNALERCGRQRSVPCSISNQHMQTSFRNGITMLAKNTSQEPFDVPAKLVEAAAAKKTGPYVDADLGDVPVDFLADLHITGGNSGSATLDARGELTGLVFDGNYEAMAADWLFMPEITRSIHVDVRYVLWLLDAVAGADHLLREMNVTPKID